MDIFDDVRDAFCLPKGWGVRDYTGPEKKFLKSGGLLERGGQPKIGRLDTSLEQCLLPRFMFYVFPNLMKLSFADLTSMQKKMNW